MAKRAAEDLGAEAAHPNAGILFDEVSGEIAPTVAGSTKGDGCLAARFSSRGRTGSGTASMSSSVALASSGENTPALLSPSRSGTRRVGGVAADGKGAGALQRRDGSRGRAA